MIKCPKCGSEDVTSEKKGFSGGKALAGAVVAGPVGALAGTHGSGKIQVHCLNCGHSWDPKKEYKKNQDQQRQKDFEERAKWKSEVIRLYEKGEIEQAENLYLTRLRFDDKSPDIDTAIANLKKEINPMFLMMLLVVIIGFIIFLFLK